MRRFQNPVKNWRKPWFSFCTHFSQWSSIVKRKGNGIELLTRPVGYQELLNRQLPRYPRKRPRAARLWITTMRARTLRIGGKIQTAEISTMRNIARPVERPRPQLSRLPWRSMRELALHPLLSGQSSNSQCHPLLRCINFFVHSTYVGFYLSGNKMNWNWIEQNLFFLLYDHRGLKNVTFHLKFIIPGDLNNKK